MKYLNNPQTEAYRPYQGNIGNSMLEIKDDGRKLISPSLLFWRRLETLNEYQGALKRSDQESAKAWKKVMSDWWNTNLYTCFGVARHPDKGAILIPDVEQYLDLIVSFNKGVNLDFRSGILPDGMYEKLEGITYSKREIEKYCNKSLTLDDALESICWEDFIPDKILRLTSIITLFDQYDKQKGEADALMEVLFPKVEKQPLIGLFQFMGIDWGFSADGKYIYDDNAKMVGALPDIKEGNIRELEHICKEFNQIVETHLSPKLYVLVQTLANKR